MRIISKEVSLLYPVFYPDFHPVPHEGKVKRGGLITKPLSWKLHCPKDSEVIPVTAVISAGFYPLLHFQLKRHIPPFFWPHAHHSFGQTSFHEGPALLFPKDSGMYQGRITMGIRMTLLTFGTMLPSLQRWNISISAPSTPRQQQDLVLLLQPWKFVTSQIFAFPGSTWLAQVIISRWPAKVAIIIIKRKKRN